MPPFRRKSLNSMFDRAGRLEAFSDGLFALSIPLLHC